MALDDAWMGRARCRDLIEPDLIFFPPTRKGVQADTSEAKRICSSCPVRRTCLAYAIAHKETKGVWGGMTESERRTISRVDKIKIRRTWFNLHPLSRDKVIQ